MDDRRFDALARALAGRRNRRSALKGAFGLGIGAMTGMVLHGRTDAARRGYSGPRWPWEDIQPGPCEPYCSPGMCGVPNGCGGMCGCSGSDVCIQGACAPVCVQSGCEVCISDGQVEGCFRQTSVTCADDDDCQAQFGAGLCRIGGNGRNYCFEPMSPM